MADLLMKMPDPYEPKRKNRFILTFPTSLGINSWYVEAAARPKITITSKDIPFLNTSKKSIEEISSAIMQQIKLKRQF
jgi:hypothetical protein